MGKSLARAYSWPKEQQTKAKISRFTINDGFLILILINFVLKI